MIRIPFVVRLALDAFQQEPDEVAVFGAAVTTGSSDGEAREDALVDGAFRNCKRSGTAFGEDRRARWPGAIQRVKQPVRTVTENFDTFRKRAGRLHGTPGKHRRMILQGTVEYPPRASSTHDRGSH